MHILVTLFIYKKARMSNLRLHNPYPQPKMLHSRVKERERERERERPEI
jgi:DNA-binding HxlR family transcriptional regulator